MLAGLPGYVVLKGAGDVFVRAIDYIRDPQIDPTDADAILDRNALALLALADGGSATTTV